MNKNLQITIACFIGIYYCMALLGPTTGYFFGGILGNVHVDFYRPNDKQTDLTPDSPMWVGCWWLGFIVTGILACIVAIPVLGLPKHLPGRDELMELRLARRSTTHQERVMPDMPRIKDLPSSLGHVIKNLKYVFITLAGCCEGVVLSGMGAFLPKILERQFGLNPSFLAVIMGSIVIPSCLVGLILGGWLIKHLKLALKGILKFCIIMMFCSLLALTGVLFNCKEDISRNLNQETVVYDSQFAKYVSSLTLQKECNKMCHCDAKTFFPVCGADDITYFSPCTAGCNREERINGTKFYFNCTCVKERSAAGWEAKPLTCPRICYALPIFLSIGIIYQMSTFSIAIPALSATLRCMDSDFRSLALGIQWIFVRLLGTIPGPIIFGYLIDKACIFWNETALEGDKSKQGSCLVYDNDRLSWHIAFLIFIFKLLQLTSFSIAYLLARKYPRPSF